jgi:large subunit ribosomal protein L27
VFPNDIVIRQRGLKFHPGKNAILGKDQTIHAKVEGKVFFRENTWRKRKFYFLDIIPEELPNRDRHPPNPYNYHPELFPERAMKNHPPLKKVKRNSAVID